MSQSDPNVPRSAQSTATARSTWFQDDTAKPVSCTANVESASARNENTANGMTFGECAHRRSVSAHTQRRFNSKFTGMHAATTRKLDHPAGKFSTPTRMASAVKLIAVNRTDSAPYRNSFCRWERFLPTSVEVTPLRYANTLLVSWRLDGVGVS